MKQDIYGPLIREALVASGTEGMSTADIVETIGCSRQRVHTWRQRNAANIRIVAKTDRGGDRYVWIDTTTPTSRNGRKRAAAHEMAGGIEVGMLARVTAIRWTKEGTVVTLVTDEGLELECVL